MTMNYFRCASTILLCNLFVAAAAADCESEFQFCLSNAASLEDNTYCHDAWQQCVNAIQPVTPAVPDNVNSGSLANCIAIDYNDNSIIGFLVNSCPQKVSVKWVDEKNCATICAEIVGANARASVTGFVGTVWWAVCEYPRFPDNGFVGGGQYYCR